MNAASLLLSAEDVRVALGTGAHIDPGATAPSSMSIGDVLRAAASDSGYERFTGVSLGQGQEKPLVVSSMAVLFDSDEKASRTFGQVAEASHLRTEVDAAAVAVETVVGQNGLVSYWGYIYRGPAIVVVTLDTVDPLAVSMTDFRSLVVRAAARLAEVLR